MQPETVGNVSPMQPALEENTTSTTASTENENCIVWKWTSWHQTLVRGLLWILGKLLKKLLFLKAAQTCVSERKMIPGTILQCTELDGLPAGPTQPGTTSPCTVYLTYFQLPKRLLKGRYPAHFIRFILLFGPCNGTCLHAVMLEKKTFS